jgi:hypothetical protein
MDVLSTALEQYTGGLQRFDQPAKVSTSGTPSQPSDSMGRINCVLLYFHVHARGHTSTWGRQKKAPRYSQNLTTWGLSEFWYSAHTEGADGFISFSSGGALFSLKDLKVAQVR